MLRADAFGKLLECEWAPRLVGHEGDTVDEAIGAEHASILRMGLLLEPVVGSGKIEEVGVGGACLEKLLRKKCKSEIGCKPGKRFLAEVGSM